jgi:hypothetical protein
LTKKITGLLRHDDLHGQIWRFGNRTPKQAKQNLVTACGTVAQNIQPLERTLPYGLLGLFTADDLHHPAAVRIPCAAMAAASIPLDKAYLTAIWLETLFYGEVTLIYSIHLPRILIILLILRNERRSVWLIPLRHSLQAQTA